MVKKWCWFSHINVLHKKNFQVDSLFFVLPATLLSSTNTEKNDPYSWCTNEHSQLETFSQPCCNGIFSNCLSHNTPAQGWPCRFRSRRTTGSSILDHDFGHLCRDGQIQMSGNSDWGILNNLGASTIYIWVHANIVSAVYPSHPSSLYMMMSMAFAAFICDVDPRSMNTAWEPEVFYNITSECNSTFVIFGVLPPIQHSSNDMSIREAKWTLSPSVLVSSITSCFWLSSAGCSLQFSPFFSPLPPLHRFFFECLRHWNTLVHQIGIVDLCSFCCPLLLFFAFRRIGHIFTNLWPPSVWPGGRLFPCQSPSRPCISIRWIFIQYSECCDTCPCICQLSISTFHQSLMFLSSITSKNVFVALLTSIYFSGIRNDSYLGSYNLTLGSTLWRWKKLHEMGQKIIPNFNIMQRWFLKWGWRRLVWLFTEDFLVLLLGLGDPRLRWMFSEPALIQRWLSFPSAIGTRNCSPLMGVDTSFALNLIASISDASICSNSSVVCHTGWIVSTVLPSLAPLQRSDEYVQTHILHCGFRGPHFSKSPNFPLESRLYQCVLREKTLYFWFSNRHRNFGPSWKEFKKLCFPDTTFSRGSARNSWEELAASLCSGTFSSTRPCLNSCSFSGKLCDRFPRTSSLSFWIWFLGFCWSTRRVSSPSTSSLILSLLVKLDAPWESRFPAMNMLEKLVKMRLKSLSIDRGQRMLHSSAFLDDVGFLATGPVVKKPVIFAEFSELKNCQCVFQEAQLSCEGEVIVIRPHLLGESAQEIYYLTSGKLKGKRKYLKMKKRKKVKLMKRSRKSERTLNSCMRHGDDHGMEWEANAKILNQCAMCKLWVWQQQNRDWLL